MLSDLGTGGVGSLNVRQVLRRLGEALQVIGVDHRGDATAPAGEEHGRVGHPGVVDDIGEPVARSGNSHFSHNRHYGRKVRECTFRY